MNFQSISMGNGHYMYTTNRTCVYSICHHFFVSSKLATSIGRVNHTILCRTDQTRPYQSVYTSARVLIFICNLNLIGVSCNVKHTNFVAIIKTRLNSHWVQRMITKWKFYSLETRALAFVCFFKTAI